MLVDSNTNHAADLSIVSISRVAGLPRRAKVYQLKY